MAISTQVSNISIEPVDARWGNEEMWCIDFIDDVAAALAGTYFTGEAIDIDGVLTSYYVWFDDSVAADPAPGGTGIAVPLTSGDSKSVLSAAAAVAINASGLDINSVDRLVAGQLLLQNKFMGAVADVADGAAPTGFAFAQQQIGDRLDLGFTDEIELSMSELLVDITASQQGGEVLTRLRNGNEVGPLSIAMKEGEAAKIKEFLEVGGELVIPAGGTEVAAWGKSKNFLNVISDAKKLVLHPTRKADSDFSEDYAMWNAYPNLSSINFSGESEKLITVEFTIYQDELKVDTASKLVFGDSSQNFLKA